MVAVMKEVAVIGAGSAGLVASRHLVRCGIRPTIFEASCQVGGAWNGNFVVSGDESSSSKSRRSTTGSNMWNHLTTNLSKFTCSFSDFPWSTEGASSTELFPSRHDVQNYLESYSNRFIDPSCFRFGCKVSHLKKQQHNDRYEVKWIETGNEAADKENLCQEFDGVVVATGFFSKMIMPEEIASDVDEMNALMADRRVIHSSEYERPEEFKDQTVAIVGGSFSAFEIAADIAPQANRIIHILPKTPYVLPRYLPMNGQDGSNCRALPLDLILYQRKQDEKASTGVRETVTMNVEACRTRHTKLQAILGSRQKDTILGFPDNLNEPPLIAISDNYLSWLVQKKIEVVRGRLMDISATRGTEEQQQEKKGVLKLQVNPHQGSTTHIDAVDRVICCTGYRPRLGFLDVNILDALKYREKDGFAPLELAYDTFHPSLPGFFCVGMYRGPFFGVMEMQARLAAAIFTGYRPSPTFVKQGLKDSQVIRNQNPRPQFPHFDYVGLMDTLASELDLCPPVPASFGDDGNHLPESKMMVTPAFFHHNCDIARHALELIDKEVRTSYKHVPHVVLRALIGKWTFQRTIQHFHTDGTVAREDSITGTIRFSLMEDGATVLYREDGEFRLPTGNVVDVFREYEYTHNEQDGNMEIHFVEGGQRAHLFLSLKFDDDHQQQEKHAERPIPRKTFFQAASEHLCIKDLYKGKFGVQMNGLAAHALRMTYRVKGPEKDYEADTHCQPLL